MAAAAVLAAGCHHYTSIATTELPRLNGVMMGTEARVSDIRKPDGSFVAIDEVLEVVMVPKDPALAPIAVERPVRAYLTDEGVLVVQGEAGGLRRFALAETDHVEVKRRDRAGNVTWGVLAGLVVTGGLVLGALILFVPTAG